MTDERADPNSISIRGWLVAGFLLIRVAVLREGVAKRPDLRGTASAAR